MPSLRRPAAVAAPTVLNYVVAGEVRCGASVVQTVLDAVPGSVCHGELFFREYGTPREQEARRREAHEAYFGACPEPDRLPEWFVEVEPHVTNPFRYLGGRVFDNPRHGETRIGVRLGYDVIERCEFAELFSRRCAEGDFCLVHVVRNPISCFVSLLQARRSGKWSEPAGSRSSPCAPPPITLDPEEVTHFVRRSLATRRRVESSCDDRLDVEYRRLVFDAKRAMEEVCEFLEIPQQRLPSPAVRRHRNLDMRSRVRNFTALQRELPPDVGRLLAEDFF